VLFFREYRKVSAARVHNAQRSLAGREDWEQERPKARRVRSCTPDAANPIERIPVLGRIRARLILGTAQLLIPESVFARPGMAGAGFNAPASVTSSLSDVAPLRVLLRFHRTASGAIGKFHPALRSMTTTLAVSIEHAQQPF
jgi:hypothetical protein